MSPRKNDADAFFPVPHERETLSGDHRDASALFDNMLNGYAYCKMLYDEEGNPADWVYLRVNTSFERLTGLKNVESRRVTELIPDLRETNPELFEAYGRVARGGAQEVFEVEVRQLGVTLNVLVFCPKVGFFVAVFEDVTKPRSVERELREKEQIVTAFLDSINESAVLTDADGTIIAANATLARRLNRAVEEMIGRNIYSFFPADVAARRKRNIDRVIETGSPLIFQDERDGRAFENRVYPIKDESGKVKRLAVLGLDLTEIRKKEKILEALHVHAQDLEAALTRDEVIASTYKAMRETLNYKYTAIGDVRGDGIHFLPLPGSFTFQEIIIPLTGTSISLRAVRTLKPQLVSDTRSDPDYYKDPYDPADYLSELSVPVVVDGRAPLILEVAEVQASQFSLLDIQLIETLAVHVSSALSRIGRAEELEELRRARLRDIVESAEKVTGMVRHDLRGPLQTISNAAYVIQAHPEKSEEMYRLIQDNVAYSTNLLEELQLNTTGARVNRARTRLGELVAQSLSDQSIPEGIRVVTELEQDVALQLDRIKIRRVVYNLVKNAVEAMPGGGVLRIRLRAEEGSAVLEVQDTGQGISREAAESVFTPFFTTKPKGTGLGLSFCKQVVEAHGGTLTFTSEAGEGTTFTVRLPSRRLHAASGDASAARLASD